jgi:hypothetical protein
LVSYVYKNLKNYFTGEVVRISAIKIYILINLRLNLKSTFVEYASIAIFVNLSYNIIVGKNNNALYKIKNI